MVSANNKRSEIKNLLNVTKLQIVLIRLTALTYNICVCVRVCVCVCVRVCVYIHPCVYIFKKNITFIYIILIQIYTCIFTCKYFQDIQCVCIVNYIYIIHLHRIHIQCKWKLLFWMRLIAIDRLTAINQLTLRKDPPPFVTVASHAALMLHIMFSHTL